MEQPMNVECCKCGYPIQMLEFEAKKTANTPEAIASVNAHLAEQRFLRNRITGELVKDQARCVLCSAPCAPNAEDGLSHTCKPCGSSWGKPSWA